MGPGAVVYRRFGWRWLGLVLVIGYDPLDHLHRERHGRQGQQAFWNGDDR
jgi:hypothetical protein